MKIQNNTFYCNVKKVNEEWREILIDIENDLTGTFKYVLSNTPTITSNLISTVCSLILQYLYTHNNNQ